MMGVSHSATAAAAWIAVSALAPWTAADPGLSPSTVVLGTLVAAGAGLAPDADQRHSTVAHCLPPVSRWVCALVGKVAGGHRQLTHSILGLAVFSAACWAACQVTVVGWPPVALGLTVFMVALGAKTLGIARNWVASWLVAAFTAVAVIALDLDLSWVPWAVTLGAVVHVVGDSMTTERVNWLYPLVLRPPAWVTRTPVLKSGWARNGRMGFPILGSTGAGNALTGRRGMNARQQVLTALCTLYIAVTLIWLGAGEMARYVDGLRESGGVAAVDPADGAPSSERGLVDR